MNVNGVIRSLVLVVLAIVAFVAGPVSAERLVVDDDGGPWADFTTIQEAVDAAAPGDLIRVFDGTYRENVVIDVQVSLSGNGTLATVVDADRSGTGINITSDGVNVNMLSVINSGADSNHSGVQVSQADGCLINDSAISDHRFGVFIDRSSSSRVLDCTISDNGRGGIVASFLSTGTFRSNVLLNDSTAVELRNSIHVVIDGCSYDDCELAVGLRYAEDCELYDNVMTGCGIFFVGESSAHFTHTIPNNNTVNGDSVVYMEGQTGGTAAPNAGEVIIVNCDNVTVTGQTIADASVGAIVAFSAGTTVTNCALTGHSIFGLYAFNSNWTSIDTLDSSGNEIGGVVLHSSKATVISSLNASDCTIGIWVWGSNRTSASDVEIWNCTYGAYLNNCSRCTIANGPIGRNLFGVYLVAADRCRLEDLQITDCVYGVIESSDSHHNTLISSSIGGCSVGFFAVDHSHSSSLVDSDITGSSSYDIDISDYVPRAGGEGAGLRLVNTTFDGDIWIDNSTMYVVNYLTLYTLDNGDPLAGVDAEVLDGEATVYATSGYGGSDPKTGSDGKVHSILVTDMTYDDSSTPTENVTTVNMEYADWNETRDVDMSASHTETFNVTTSREVIYVDDDNAGDPDMDGTIEHPYDTVQRGMDNATENMTIRVFAGDYQENVLVDVANLTIIGNGTADTTIDAANTGTVMTITSPYIEVMDLHLTDGGPNNDDYGLWIDGASGATDVSLQRIEVDACNRGVFVSSTARVTIFNCTLTGNVYGLFVDTIDHLSIIGSSMSSNTNTGIYVDSGLNVSVSDGTVVQGNPQYGIFTTASTGVTITGSSLSSNANSGIYVTTSSGVRVSSCTLTGNGEGVYFTGGATRCSVVGCEIRDSTSNGVAFRANSDDNEIDLCVIRDNNNGISLQSTTGIYANNTNISGSGSNDWELATNSEATSINVTFAADGVSCDLTSTLVVKNYLTIRVVNQAHDPLRNSDVEVLDNGDHRYRTPYYGGPDDRTDRRGYILPLLITDRIYDNSNTATENATDCNVHYEDDKGSYDANVSIDMSTTHVELVVINISLEGYLFVDDDNRGDPDMNGSLEHPFDTITRALDNATDNTTIRVFAGRYEERLDVDQRVKIIGNGTNTTLKALAGEDAIFVSHDNVSIERMIINKASGSVAAVNSSLGHWDLAVRRVWIRGFAAGINVVNSSRVVLSNVFITGSGAPVILRNVDDSLIEHGVISRVTGGDKGIHLDGVSNCTIDNVTVNTFYSAIVADEVSGLLVNGSTFYDVYHGIVSVGSMVDGMVVEECRFNDSVFGVYVEGEIGEVCDAEVLDCEFEDISGRAVHLRLATDGMVAGSRFESAGTAVHLDSSAGIEVHNNTLRNGSWGINLTASVGNEVRDNEIWSVSERAVLVANSYSGAANLVGWNRIGANMSWGTTGEGIVNIQSDGTEMTANEVANTTEMAVRIIRSEGLSLSRNVLEGNSMNYDVRGNDVGDYSHRIFQTNSIDGRTVYYKVDRTGLAIEGDAGFLAFINCTGTFSNGSVGPNGQGLIVFDSDRVRVTNLTIGRADTDIVADGWTNVTLVNTPFDESRLKVGPDSSVRVRNYLHVHVNDTQGNDLEGADVRVDDGEKTIYASAGYGGSDPGTDAEGYVRWIVVTDRMYRGGTNAEENATSVSAKHDGWEATKGDVNMNRSHTEWFDEGSGAGNQRPSCFIQEPDEGDTVGGDYTVTGNASDSDGTVTSVWVRIDSNGTWRLATGTTQWSYEWNTSSSGDGDHTVFARAFDNEGAVSIVDEVNVTVDNTNIPPKVRIDAPSEGEEVSGDVLVSGTAEDDDGEDDIDKVEVAVVPRGETPAEDDWKDATDTSGNGSWSEWERRWNTSKYADGNYTIWARADDGIARGYWRVNVTLLNQDPPEVRVISPEEGWAVNSTVAIDGTAMDPDPTDEVESVYVAVVKNGTAPKGSDWKEAEDVSDVGDPPFLNWTYEWDSTDVEDGDYTIHARAYDGTDLSRVWRVNITVDNYNSEPRTVIEDPVEDAKVSGVINVTGFVVDPDDEPDSVEIAIDDQDFSSNTLSVTVEKVGDDRWNISAKWDTTVYSEGEHTIFARATDGRGAVSNVWAVNVTVYGNVPPDIWFVEPSEEMDLYKGEGTVYVIQWGDDDPDDNASIALYYDTDDDMEDGILIADGLFEDTKDAQRREVDKHQWDFGDVPEGAYYLYAEIDDGENPVQRAISPKVTIHEGYPNTAPSPEITQPDGVGDEIELNGIFIIYFNITDEDDDLADVKVYLYRDNDTDPDNGRFQISGSLDGEDTMFEWNTSGLPRGNYYVHIRAEDDFSEGWATSDGPVSIGDMTPPGAVRNLTVDDTGFGRSIGLVWDAPGEDGLVGGRVDHYLLRWHTSEVDEDSWDDATTVDISALAPADPGVQQEFIVRGLVKGTLYHFGIRAVDDEGNVGPVRSGSATPSRLERSVQVTGYPGFSVIVEYVGTGTLTADRASADQFVPASLADLGIFIEVIGTGFLREVHLNITYPVGGVAGVDLEEAGIYWKSGPTSWSRLTSTDHDETARLIWGELDRLSIFAPFGMPVADPQLTGLDWEPRVPEDGEKVRFRVTYTDLAGRVPDRVSLRVTPEGGSPESYQMSLVEGEVETGATYEVEWSFPAGTYSIVVRATVGSIEKDSSQTTLIVEEKEEDDGLPWTLIIAAVAAAVIVALIIVRTRRRAVTKKAAKEGTAGIDVVEASVMGEEAFQEVEVAQAAAAAAPPREVPPHIAGAEAPATTEGAAVGPAAPPQVPMGVPTVPVRPPTPGATPARLQLPELPEEVPETPEAPTQAIETDVVDTGRLLIAPCPSCGSRLVIPRERPADVRCQKCGDEFTIN